ncbi:hypothetical protein Cgig2_030352 [Carnegiea gigantea]|uniref:Uncharacterized protein n=1 Tax=Carnegiea gigantea TaxID=171969 RepID=A0A9Q1KKW9_9CARY|nr:hypothetical protein Cgig2_030352 [Carnegiea gigantea]
MFTNLLYPNKQKVLFLTAVGHPPHFIMFSGNYLCFTSVSEESVLAETSPTEQSTHEAPEVAIGSTTEDIIIGPVNYLKIKGPEGVCEKRVMQKDGQYSLYVRADLPGLAPHLCVTTVRDRCILVYGRSQSERNYLKGGRSYLFFVKLRCSCCKFDTLCQNHEDGVLRMFCKIIRLEPFLLLSIILPWYVGSTTKDIIGYINCLKMKGPEGVCKKDVVQVDGHYSLYVRADLPGLEPHLLVTTVRYHCILVYGKPQSKKNYRKETVSDDMRIILIKDSEVALTRNWALQSWIKQVALFLEQTAITAKDQDQTTGPDSGPGTRLGSWIRICIQFPDLFCTSDFKI